MTAFSPRARAGRISLGKPLLTALLLGGLGATALAANLPPTVAIVSPAADAALVGPATISLTVNAADADGSVARVMYFSGATQIGGSSVVPFSASWANVAPGTYSIVAKASDNMGALTTSAPRTVVVKPNQLPTVSVRTPANNASVVAPATIALTADAADSDGAVTMVQYFQGTTVIGRSVTPPYAVNFYNPAVGSYVITAVAYDDKGGVTTSAPVAVTVKSNLAPTVSLTAPLPNASFTGPASIAFAAAASDSDGSIAKVQYYSGGLLLGSATTAPYAFTWTGVGAGSYSVTAKATDDKGAATSSAAVAVTVTASGNQAPRVSLTAPLANSVYTAPAAIALAASASDADGRVVKVDFYQGSTLLGSSTSAPFAFNWTNVPAGSYSISARATDDKGAIASSAAVPVTVNPKANVAPTVSLSANPASGVAPASITLSATASDADGSVTMVEFFNGASSLARVTQAPYTFAWNGVAAGTYSVTARATDNANAMTMSAPVTVTVSPAGGNAPQAYYIHADQIDTARLITNSAGQPVWKMDLEPFEANLPDDNPAGQGVFTYNLRFPGQYYDRETGLHYNDYRDYDPQTGRYVQSDPIGLEGGFNTYAYVNSDPLALVDPDGLMNYSRDFIGPLNRNDYYTDQMTRTKCGLVPPAPPGASVNRNINLAGRNVNPIWFRNTVKNRGPMDYKQRGPLYEDFGNFNYGAAGYSFGFSQTVLLKEAGRAQRSAGTSPNTQSWGTAGSRFNPFDDGKAPYGDDPADQRQIKRGIEYCKCMIGK